MINRFKSLKNLKNLNHIKRFYRLGVYDFFNKNKYTNEKIYAKDIFFNCLKNNGVTDTFIYSGGSIMPLIDSLYKSDIRYFVNSHEQNCGHAATGYAKTSNKTGVVMVTSGPGITNMITPMLDATNDSTPLVVFSGQVPLNAVGTNAFQEAPAVQLTKNVTKFSYQIKNILELESVINYAFQVANRGKKGSVHIDIPKCIASGSIDTNIYNVLLERYYMDKLFKENLKQSFKYIISKTKYNNYNKVAKIINNSHKPIIYLGQGCKNHYELLREFAIEANIPVTSTIHGCGIFDDDHKLSLRWCGMHGYAPANYSLQEADCIIALGSRFDDRTTGNVKDYAPNAFKSKAIIHVNIEKSEIKKVVKSHYNFNMCCGKFLSNIIPKVKFNERDEWINNIQELKTKYPFHLKTHEIALNMENVLDKLYIKTKKLNDKIIFTTGVGNHQMQTYQFIKAHYPNKIISSGSLGVMGAGLPYAIGSQIANKDKMVICIDGDSSFNMTCSDLKTIVENDLPVKICIMNNDSQMMVTIWEKLFFEERYTATINEKNPSFKSLAESYGIKGLYCDNVKDLDSTLDTFINYPKAILCEFKIKKDICLPLVGPGKALDNMILPRYNEDIEDNNGKIQIEDGMAPS